MFHEKLHPLESKLNGQEKVIAGMENLGLVTGRWSLRQVVKHGLWLVGNGKAVHGGTKET
jgi:hypothetical protein